MNDTSNLTSAAAVERAHEEEKRLQQFIEIDRATDRNLHESEIATLQESNRLLKQQLNLQIKQNEESSAGLKKSKKMNAAMLIVSLVSVAVAIASLVAAVIK